MKRFLPLFFALLLVFPLLFVPALAAPASISIDGTVVDSAMCSFDISSVPSGSYFITLSVQLGGTVAYTNDPVFIPGSDASFDIYACSDQLGACVALPSQIVSGQLFVANILDLPPGMPLTLTFAPADNAALLSDFSAVASAVIDWVGQIAAAIVDHPLLLVTVGIFFVGGCIALFGRLLSRN